MFHSLLQNKLPKYYIKPFTKSIILQWPQKNISKQSPLSISGYLKRLIYGYLGAANLPHTQWANFLYREPKAFKESRFERGKIIIQGKKKYFNTHTQKTGKSFFLYIFTPPLVFETFGIFCPPLKFKLTPEPRQFAPRKRKKNRKKSKPTKTETKVDRLFFKSFFLKRRYGYT